MAGAVTRRAREQRAIYARFPDNNMRTNRPNGYPGIYLPVAQPGDAADVVGQQAAWWYGSDAAGGGRTTGSPLTVPARPGGGDVPAGSVLPAITKCVQTIVEAVVGTRWIYRDGQGRTLPRPLWIDDPMLMGRSPGPIGSLSPVGWRMGGQAFFGTLLSDAILWGRGSFRFVEAADGTPLPGTLQLLNPFMIQVTDEGLILIDPWGQNPVTTDPDGRFEFEGNTWRVALVPGLYPNHHGWPQGVLLRHFDTFRVGARLTGYLDGMFTSGVPSGYLSVTTPNFGAEMTVDPSNPDQLIREDVALKQEWMAAHGTGRRSVAVLNAAVAYTPIAINPVDADVANLLSASRKDVAHAFGMSSVWLDEAVGGLTYSNASERRADLVGTVLRGWGARFTDVLSSLMPYGTRCDVHWPNYISPSPETSSPFLAQNVQAGIMTATEARAELGIVPWEMPDPDFVDTSKATGNTPPPPPPPGGPPAPPEEAPQ